MYNCQINLTTATGEVRDIGNSSILCPCLHEFYQSVVHVSVILGSVTLCARSISLEYFIKIHILTKFDEILFCNQETCRLSVFAEKSCPNYMYYKFLLGKKKKNHAQLII